MNITLTLPECTNKEDELDCDYQSPECGPERVNAGQKCWQLFHNVDSWSEAYDQCRQRNQTLINLSSVHDMEYFSRYVIYNNFVSIS